ncbi:MAG: 16S rRNA (adenine(1518)-N(6)/adenine(1519)-N(6))-dimethyltransferase RsmA [Candidatus Bipolaricaulota bacterium]
MADLPRGREEVRRALSVAGVRPSKARGQNFLVDARAAAEVADAVLACGAGDVVEIGPGLGALTQAVAAVARHVTCLEIDPRLASWLSQRVAAEGLSNVSVCEEDAVSFDLGRVSHENRMLVVGSIPYSVTAPLLQMLIRQRAALRGAVLITQREVAEKILASPGKEGTALGTMVRAYAEVRILRNLSPRSFEPSPEVESTLWTLTFLSSPRFSSSESSFFRIVRGIYGARRKTLRNALARVIPSQDVPRVLTAAGVDSGLRGETLDFPDLDRMAAELDCLAAAPSAEGEPGSVRRARAPEKPD